MAKKNDDLFETLRARGLRKRVARSVADIEKGGRSAGGKAEKAARGALADLEAAAAEIRRRVEGGPDRSAAAKKAAATRRRKAAKRSEAAKKAARTRKAKA